MVFKDPLYHHQLKNKNKTLYWLENDNEKKFKERLKKNPKDPCLISYKKNPIEYKLNNYGFRTPIDFYQGIEGNLFLGCSHTFGVGHHLKNTWSWRLNQKIGGNFLNLGVGGSGIGTAARLLYGYKDILKPKNVFLFIPHPYRYEYYDTMHKQWENVNVWFQKPKNRHTLMLIAERANMNVYWHLNFNFIKNLCQEIDVPFYTIKPVEFSGIEHEEIPDKARDDHLSLSHHLKILEDFIKVYSDDIPPNDSPWDKMQGTIKLKSIL